MTVVECAAVGETAVTQLADAVVFVARGAPALMLGDQAILHIIFVGKRPVPVVDIHQPT